MISTEQTFNTEPHFYREDGGSRGSRGGGYISTNTDIIDPELEMQAIYRNQLADFKNNKEPLIDELEASLDDRSISERADYEARRLEANSQSMARRLNTGRSGALLPSQRNAQRKDITRATSLGGASITTTAKRTERANRVATRQQLMGIAEQLTTTGTASMAQAAEQKRQREAQNEAARRARNSQGLAMVGTVVGGVAGGPMGAALGGAIGGYVGGG